MAYVTPGTVAAGDVATAAAWNVLTNDVIDLDSRLRVFTNEAARDAAITAPVEGMIVVLTAPSATSYAVTGDTYAALPSTVRTVYEGTKWVCVTPLSATTNTGGTTTSTSWTATLTSGGTNPSVKLETGTQAQLSISSIVRCVALASRQAGVSVAVSGATTLNPSGAFGASSTSVVTVGWGAYAITGSADFLIMCSRTVTLTGLTAGINTFALNYNSDGATIIFANRTLTVQGIA